MVSSETVSDQSDAGLFPQRVGEKLHTARVAANLDLNDIATRTRVPIRHLEAIERSEYGGLPSITYTLGFARSFARAVGLDPVQIARELRAELGHAPPESETSVPYEPLDPSRVPSRLLAWTAVVLAVLLLGGYIAWRSEMFAVTPADAPPPVASVTPPPAPAAVPSTAPVAAAPATGTVVLTATAPAWIRVYDRNDKVLIGRELAQGESFTVPADADQPMIRTGRADAIKVTIDGKEVAPLGPAERTIRDVGVSAAALAARAPAATPSGTVPPAGTPSANTLSSSQ